MRGFLLPLLLLSAALATNAHAETCPGGSASVLELRTEVPRMPTLQGGLGRTTVLQRFADATRPPEERAWPGIWTCAGFSAERGEFVLLHRDVRGATPAYVGVTLVHEATGALRAVSLEDLGHVVLVGPQARFAVAVVGRMLVGLDLKTLQSRELGPAPAPMPLTPEELRFYKSKRPLRWDLEPRDTTSELEPDVLQFLTATQVQVSYGKDSAFKRSPKRSQRQFDLAQPPPDFLPTKDAPRLVK